MLCLGISKIFKSLLTLSFRANTIQEVLADMFLKLVLNVTESTPDKWTEGGVHRLLRGSKKSILKGDIIRMTV